MRASRRRRATTWSSPPTWPASSATPRTGTPASIAIRSSPGSRWCCATTHSTARRRWTHSTRTGGAEAARYAMPQLVVVLERAKYWLQIRTQKRTDKGRAEIEPAHLFDMTIAQLSEGLWVNAEHTETAIKSVKPFVV